MEISKSGVPVAYIRHRRILYSDYDNRYHFPISNKERLEVRNHE